MAMFQITGDCERLVYKGFMDNPSVNFKDIALGAMTSALLLVCVSVDFYPRPLASPPGLRAVLHRKQSSETERGSISGIL